MQLKFVYKIFPEVYISWKKIVLFQMNHLKLWTTHNIDTSEGLQKFLKELIKMMRTYNTKQDSEIAFRRTQAAELLYIGTNHHLFSSFIYGTLTEIGEEPEKLSQEARIYIALLSNSHISPLTEEELFYLKCYETKGEIALYKRLDKYFQQPLEKLEPSFLRLALKIGYFKPIEKYFSTWLTSHRSSLQKFLLQILNSRMLILGNVPFGKENAELEIYIMLDIEQEILIEPLLKIYDYLFPLLQIIMEEEDFRLKHFNLEQITEQQKNIKTSKAIYHNSLKATQTFRGTYRRSVCDFLKYKLNNTSLEEWQILSPQLKILFGISLSKVRTEEDLLKCMDKEIPVNELPSMQTLLSTWPRSAEQIIQILKSLLPLLTFTEAKSRLEKLLNEVDLESPLRKLAQTALNKIPNQ